MTLEAIEIETGANPQASVIVLHGLGASGDDFVPIVRELDLGRVGPVRFVFPHAPVRPVSINGGYAMPAWYDIVSTDLGRREDEVGLRESQALVEALIAKERSRGVDCARIVLAGFSQGCAMTLQVGLRYEQRLGGLAGLSGYLPLAAKLEAERHPVNHEVPIFLAHGLHDGVVPLARAQLSRDALVALGYQVEWHEYPIAHTVSMEEIHDLQRWLERVLA